MFRNVIPTTATAATAVVPAQAGTQVRQAASGFGTNLDSRLRGNDGGGSGNDGNLRSKAA